MPWKERWGRRVRCSARATASGPGGDAGAVGDVEVDGDVEGDAGGCGGGVEIVGVLRVVDDKDEAGQASGEADGAFDPMAADHGGGDENAFDAAGGEGLGFTEFGRAGADGARGEGEAGDRRALVGLAVGAEGTTLGAGVGGHCGDVAFEGVEIDAEGRGGQIFL